MRSWAARIGVWVLGGGLLLALALPAGAGEETAVVLLEDGALVVGSPGPDASIEERVVGPGIEGKLAALLETERATVRELGKAAEAALRRSRWPVFYRAADRLDRIRPGGRETAEQRKRAEAKRERVAAASPASWTPAFDGKTLRGLRPVQGDFAVKQGALVATGAKGPSTLKVTRRPRGKEVDARIRVAQIGQGFSLSIGGSKGVRLTVERRAVTLSDGAGEEIAAAKIPRVSSVELEVLGGVVVVAVDDKPRLLACVGRDVVGDVSVHCPGAVRLAAIELRSASAPRLVTGAIDALRRGRGDLALPMATALLDEGFVAEGELLVGAARLLLGDEAEARDALRRGRRDIEASRRKEKRYSQCDEQARAVEDRVARDTASVEETYAELTEAYRERVEDLLASAGDADLAHLLSRRLLHLLPEDRSVRLLRLRAFTLARGTDGVIPLLRGSDPSRWTVRSGKFEPVDDVLTVTAKLEPHVFLREDLPADSRYHLELEFRPVSVYEVGLVLGGARGLYRLGLRNAFHEKSILLRREDGTLRMRREMAETVPKADGEWHRFGALVSRNRIAVFVDGSFVLHQVFSEPLAGNPGIFIGKNTRAEVRAVRLKLYSDDREYSETLARHGLTDHVIIEAEEALETGLQSGATREEFMPHAFNGRLLAAGFGRSEDHHAEFRFETSRWENARLHIRYRSSRNSRALRLRLDGVEQPSPVTLVPAVNDFGVVSVSLGLLERGDHVIRLHPDGDGAPVALDRLTLCGDGWSSSREDRTIASARFPQFRMKLSPGVTLPVDSDGIFAMVEDLRGYMSDTIGVVLDRPLTVNVVSRECWGDPHIGGYATGAQLFVPEETLLRDLATVAHELSHCFDHGQGVVPPWFGEGKSVPVFVDFMRERGDKYRWNALSGIDSRARTGRSTRKRLEQRDGSNLLQYWGTRLFSYGDHPLRGAAYDASAYLCVDLQKNHGTSYLEGFHALVQADLARSTYLTPPRHHEPEQRELLNAFLVDYLSRAAGEDLRPYFEEKFGFRLPVYAERDRPMEAIRTRRELYLTSPGPSRFVPAGDGASPRRALPHGEMVFAFPLPPDGEVVEVRCRVAGTGTVEADGLPPREVVTGSSESLVLTLKSMGEEVFRDRRFRLGFRAAEGGEGLSVEDLRVVVR